MTKYSKYQEDIFDFINHGVGHCIVEAVAGSGKTTTIVEAANRVPWDKRCIFVAFNKHIAEELARRLPVHVEARTLHSVGWELCRDNIRGYIKVNDNKIKNILKYEILDFDNPDDVKIFKSHISPIKKLVSLMKSAEYPPLCTFDIQPLVDRHGIELPDNWNVDLLRRVYVRSFEYTRVADYDDMIWFPLMYGWDFPKFEYVFVDESQDLSPLQISFILQLIKENGRIIAVGDTFQAIYGFRGADTEAIEGLHSTLKAKVLPLSICYRCSKSIVKEAKKIVPYIEWWENAEEGCVTRVKKLDAREGDYVLCRTTAPLVEECMYMLRNGQKAVILGRDIAENLLSTIDELNLKDSANIEAYFESLESWLTKKMKRCVGHEALTIKIQDTRDTLYALCADCETVSDVRKRIDKIFSSKGEGVTFSTIHKSKGLEADRVFIMKPELLPHPKCTEPWQKIQENNLHYVAITRAKKELYYVESKGKDR
jgi:DNA helicase-2/ATP-dependent DNA helicase PcrA